ncbi:putative ribonuclease H-like domain-containing protein [Tanacetum coccineum]
MSDSEDSTVTYTAVSSPFGGLSDIRSLGVDGPPLMPEDPYAYVVAAFQAPPSPDYVSGPEYPPSPNFVPEPVYPEFMPPEDESDPEEDPEEEDDDDEDPEEDPVDYPADEGDDGDDDEDDDVDIEGDEEEDKHPTPADSTTVALPAVDHAPSAEETELFKIDESAATPPPHPAYRVTARISIRDEPPTSFWSDTKVARLLAIPTPPPSPLSLWSSPLSQIPSPPLPPILSPLPVSPPLPVSSPPHASPIHSAKVSSWYCKEVILCRYSVPLNIGITELRTDDNVKEFLTYSDISDEYDSSEEDGDPDNVDFQTEGEENIVIPNVTTTYLFLNELCSNNGYFRGFDESSIVDRFKIKKGVSYPKFNPSLEWNKMEHVLGSYSKKKVQKKLFDDAYDVPSLSNKGKSKIPSPNLAILDTNPGSTCRLDVEETDDDNTYFKRFYVCFRGVKDGWIEGCRKIIGLDGWFLKHTCRGELLTTMGRDANNQMYPIAWAVVKVENKDNCLWFLGLLHDDLNLQHGCGLIVILDSHKITRTKYQLADLFTEVLPNEMFEYLVHRIGMQCMTPTELDRLITSWMRSVGIKRLHDDLKVTAAKGCVTATNYREMYCTSNNKIFEGVETTITPTTAEEKAQRRLELKARITLLMGIPNEHQLKFNSINDAKSLLSNSEVSTDSNCSSSCLENVKILKEQNEQLLKDLRTSKLNVIAYKTGFESVEARLLGNPQMDLQDQGVIDSGCSRHMTRNMSYLIDYEEIDEGYVAFGGNPKGGKITSRAERKNRTLIEAARTMLADSKPLTTFWAEEVNTACYVQKRVLVTKPHNKTPYELFLGRNPALGFKRPFGCLVTILNTIDHLGKFNGKADEGFFVGYSINSRKECDDAGKARIETVPSKDYILLPLWTADPPFSQSSKNSPDAGFKPSGDSEKKVTEEPGKEGGDPIKEDERDDQEKDASVNSTNNVNAASINEVNVVGRKVSIKLPDEPNMPALEDIVYSDDDEDVGAQADMNNLDTFMPVSPIPTTRVHKDHPIEQIIGDFNLSPQIRRMTKSLEEHGLFSLVQQRTNHKDFQNYLFICFLSQVGPKKMDIKSAFLYGNIEEEVYVCQPPGFEDPDFPNKKEDGIFISQDKFVTEILKKFGFIAVKTASTPMETQKLLLKDKDGEEVDVHLYRSMIGSLMYLTSSRPDIMFAVCACTRYQVDPKVSHLYAVKRIFRNLKGHQNGGLGIQKILLLICRYTC